MLRDGKFQGYEISGLEMVVEETGEMIPKAVTSPCRGVTTHFPASLAVGCGHVTTFQPMACEPLSRSCPEEALFLLSSSASWMERTLNAKEDRAKNSGRP